MADDQDEHGRAFRRLGAVFARDGRDYQRLRPGFPVEAIAWRAEGLGPSALAVDVEASTGKLSVPLAARGLRVIAVDPS